MVRRALMTAAWIVVAPGAILIATPNGALALPDLVPDIPSYSVDYDATVDPDDVIEGCAGGQTNRVLIRYGLRTSNPSSDDLIIGDPACPNCAENPGLQCGNPLFECSTAHGHAHFDEYVKAELLDSVGDVVAIGHKQGFCLLDTECDVPVYTCGFQGISAGCADVYAEGLPCQYIDITDLGIPPAAYTLRVTVDPNDEISESDEANNVTSVPIVVGYPPPTCPVYSATDVPIAIPDQTTIASTITAPDIVVDSVRIVALGVTHNYIGDLEFRLFAPSGTDVVVIDEICTNDKELALDLSDAAAQTIPCPPDDGGLYLPDNPLAPFEGENANGTWTLEVEDIGNLDTGTLNQWGLEICPRCGNGILDAGEICDDGNVVDGDCCSSDCQSQTPDETPCTDAPNCLTGGHCHSGSCHDSVVSCDPCLVCTPPMGCTPPEDALCEGTQPNVSRFLLRKHPTDATRDSLSFTWKGGSPVSLSDFGSPTSVTDMTLCVFDDDGLELSATIPSGTTCDGEDCWRPRTHGWVYDDPDDPPGGVGRAILRAGDAGHSGIRIRGRGAFLGVPTLDLDGDVTVRLKRDDGTPCWQTEFSAPDDNTARRYKATFHP